MNKELSTTDAVKNPIKKAYLKPLVSKVHLLAEEAVLATCKTGAGSSARSICRAVGDLTCVSTWRS